MDWLRAFLDAVLIKYFEIVSHMQFLDDLMDMSVLFFAVAQIICAVGLFVIFSKMRTKQWPALIPVTGIYWLGEMIHRRIAAVFVVLAKLLFLFSFLEYLLVMYQPVNKEYQVFLEYDTHVMALCLLMMTGAFLIRMAAGFFLYGHLCRQYESRKWWLIPFSLIPNITLLFWSMNPKIRD